MYFLFWHLILAFSYYFLLNSRTRLLSLSIAKTRKEAVGENPSGIKLWSVQDVFAALYKTLTVRKENPKPLGFSPISLSPSTLAYKGNAGGSWVGLCHFSHSPAQHVSHSTQHCGPRSEEALRSPQHPILQQPSCAPPAQLPGPGEEGSGSAWQPRLASLFSAKSLPGKQGRNGEEAPCSEKRRRGATSRCLQQL